MNGMLTDRTALSGPEASQPGIAAAVSMLSNSMTPHLRSEQLAPHTAAAAALVACATDGSMSRASNGYLMITNPNPSAAQHLPHGTSGSVCHPAAPSAPATSGAAHIASAAVTSATAAPAHPVAPPTQLGANGSVHIHPRHLAFQHFQQQQAALQQQQQQQHVNGHGMATAHSLDSTDGDALERMDRAASLASTQSDAIRHATYLSCCCEASQGPRGNPKSWPAVCLESRQAAIQLH